MKIHKTKKVKKMRGRKAGTHGWGARKKHKKSGHRGGSGMSGSGKRADHKKTLITKLYGSAYFGKKGVTSRKTAKRKTKKINLSQIQDNIENFVKKKVAVKNSSGYEINFSDYKILGTGEVSQKLIIKAKEASKSALEKIKKSGGEIIIIRKKKPEEKEKEVEKKNSEQK